MNRIFIAAAALSALAACADPPRDAGPGDGAPGFYRLLDASDARVDAAAARDMISIHRRNHGLPTLVLDGAAQRAAETAVAAMAANNDASAARLGPLARRIEASGASRAVAVENVSAGYRTLAEAFSGWRDSKPHNANMLNPGVRRMGLATAFAPGSKYKVFWALVLTD
jgi:uncharacterized protein YkwD